MQKTQEFPETDSVAVNLQCEPANIIGPGWSLGPVERAARVRPGPVACGPAPAIQHSWWSGSLDSALRSPAKQSPDHWGMRARDGAAN